MIKAKYVRSAGLGLVFGYIVVAMVLGLARVEMVTASHVIAVVGAVLCTVRD